MTRILRFKNPCLTLQEYDMITKLVPSLSTEDFDKITWQNQPEYYFISDQKELKLSLELLQNLCRDFPVVVLDNKQIIIKNQGGKI